MAVHPGQKTGELVGLLFLAAALLVGLSLFSYDGLDPSANVSSPSLDYSNYVGQVGAWGSDFLLDLLGFGAVYLPLVLLFLGYRILRGGAIQYPFVKLLGIFGTLLSLCAGLSLANPELPANVNFTPGGRTGLIISHFLLGLLNGPGTVVAVATLLVLSLMLTTRLSLNAILAWIDAGHWNVFSSAPAYLAEWRKKRSNRRKLARLAAARTVVSQPSPHKVVLDERAVPPDEERIPESAPKVAPPTVSRPAPPSVEPVQPAPHSLIPTPQGSLQRPYRPPPMDFLQTSSEAAQLDEQELMERAQTLATKCAEFGVHGRVLQIHPGPVVTTFEFKPEAGVKYNKITNLSEDLCLAMKAESIRIDRIPGKNTVGIEVPNLSRQVINLREILEGAAFQQSPSHLTLSLGKLINGNSYVSNLARMPHLLIAGATGAGKSVGLNCMVCSILYKSSPAEVRFIMIDPKRLELGVYEDIPHLLTPIVTDPKQASNALNWAVHEMEERYKILAQEGVRNIDQYNKLVYEGGEGFADVDPLPYIVIIVDELADLMMTAGKEVEVAVTRLAQMARAVGIHLILATQRPSVDVLTGLIKANFPCRISFRVSSKVDSRTILDCNGAEQLLGQGDMLFLPPGTSRLIRIHGAFISEGEIHRITEFLKQQAEPEYHEEVLAGDSEEVDGFLAGMGDLKDDLYDEAIRFVAESGKASTSLLQRRFRIGYGRAARLLDMMEHEGIVGPPDGSKPREVLVSPENLGPA